MDMSNRSLRSDKIHVRSSCRKGVVFGLCLSFIFIILCPVSFAAGTSDGSDVYISAHDLGNYMTSCLFSYTEYETGNVIVQQPSSMFYVDEDRDIIWFTIDGTSAAGSQGSISLTFELNFGFDFYTTSSFSPHLYTLSINRAQAVFPPATMSVYSSTSNIGNVSSSGFTYSTAPVNYGVGNMYFYTSRGATRYLIDYNFPSRSFGSEDYPCRSLNFIISREVDNYQSFVGNCICIGVSGFYVHPLSNIFIPVPQIVGWAGRVMNSLLPNGQLYALLPFFCVFIAVPVVLIGIKIVRKVCWGT